MKIRISRVAFAAWVNVQPDDRVFQQGTFRSCSCPLACYLREVVPGFAKGWVGWRHFGHNIEQPDAGHPLPQWAVDFISHVDEADPATPMDMALIKSAMAKIVS